MVSASSPSKSQSLCCLGHLPYDQIGAKFTCWLPGNMQWKQWSQRKLKGFYTEQLNQFKEDIGFSLANKLKKRHILWQKHKISVPWAVQTLSASVPHSLDFLQDEMALETFAGSKPTPDFIKKIDEVFDLLNSRNHFAKGNHAPVSPDTLPYFLEKCYEISNYIFALKNEKCNFLRTGQRKTVIWGFMFSIYWP